MLSLSYVDRLINQKRSFDEIEKELKQDLKEKRRKLTPEEQKYYTEVDNRISAAEKEQRRPSLDQKPLRIIAQMDYIPIVATIKALAHFILHLFSDFLPASITENRAFSQLMNESHARAATFIVLPIISSPLAFIYDFYL